ncbi:hypothetical protein CYY_007247 [Polysphondylium violaceum]|uniref:Acyl-coenzyme A oxidase n=1 Tax=Polysphondylium violaceum TaxID=133409 RepID=A0A8J4PPW1_9MYCE|nr:hypothetical protein CYY_007247 [Polysphondylium violaceum]
MESAKRRINHITQNLIGVNDVSSDGSNQDTSSQSSGVLEITKTFDTDSLNRYLFPYNRDMRKKLLEVWRSEPLLTQPTFGLSLKEERELSVIQFKRLLSLAKENISIWDIMNDPKKVAAFTQCYRLKNIATSTLFGVHYSLFGSSILFLGSDEQRNYYLPKVENLDLMGCFALTELGHGSNVQAIETIAEYDHSKEEFVLNSPTITSQKYFIGGAAKNANFSVVFAQLKVGEKMEGVHAFIVKIRDDSGRPTTGVKIGDCGHKMALNGVDNGRLMFNNVRIPRESLLSRYGGVNKAGIYSSPINPAIKRFAHNIGALVFGRYIVSLGSVSFSSVALGVSLRYAFSRKQFFGDDSNAQEKQLITYATHQKRLIPHLANTYAVHFGNEYFIHLLAEKDKKNDKEIHIVASALKSYASWATRDCLQDARECCGGQGFLSENLIGIFKSETEIYTTFEGDNVLLYQQVAKFILSEARRKPVPEFTVQSDSQKKQCDRKYLTSFEFLTTAMNNRLYQNIAYVTDKLTEAIGNGKSVMDAWNDSGNIILRLGIAYSEKFILDKFINGVVNCPDSTAQSVMTLLVSLYGLNIIEKDNWFLRYNYISTDQSEAIYQLIPELCKEIVPHSVSLVDALGFDGNELGATISGDWIEKNKY